MITVKVTLELTKDEAEVLLSVLADNSFKSVQCDSIWRKYSKVFTNLFFAKASA